MDPGFAAWGDFDHPTLALGGNDLFWQKNIKQIRKTSITYFDEIKSND